MKKFVISSVAVASFAFALVASAATAADMGSVTLRQGSRGAAVSALQSNLNNCAGQSLSTDGIFGSGTAAAVRAFQSSKGLTVDALVGNGTKSALSAACAGTTTNNNNNNTNTGSTTLNGADARLNKITLRSEDNANAGSRDQEVASFEIDLARNSGDIELNRVDLEVSIKSKTASTEDRLFRIFDAISIADKDGKVLGSAKTTSRNDWTNSTTVGLDSSDAVVTTGAVKNRSTAELTIIGLKGIAKGDARTQFKVLVDTARLSESDLDIAGSIKIKAVRYTEAIGVSVTELAGSSVLPSSQIATFTIEGEDSSDLRVTRSTANPKESTIKGSETSEIKDATVFVFNVESRKVDAEIDTMKVNLSGTAADATHIKRARIYRGTTELASANISSGAVNFDLRDYALRADRSEEFSVKLDLAKIGGSVTGGTIKVDSVDVTVYDNNDKEVTKSVTNTVEHTFSLPVATKVSGQYVAPVLNNDGDTTTAGFISIKFEVDEALSGKVIRTTTNAITHSVAGILAGTGAGAGISYELYEDNGQTLVADNTTVNEGEEYVFVVKFGKTDSFPNPEFEIKSIAGISVTGLKHSR